MESEKTVVLALSGEEIQEAVLFKLRECMQKNCHLSLTNAYTSAKVDISVKMVLFDYGREVRNNEVSKVELDSGLPHENEPETIDASISLEPMPPNQLRVETDQAVPVVTTTEGKKQVKRLKYAPRKAPA